MRIFISGGAGFIGSHIVRLLLDTPNEIVIYDRLNPLSFMNSPKINYIKGDLPD